MTKELLPYQQRVIEERAQLDERLHKLNTFLIAPNRPPISDEEYTRLEMQASAMTLYSHILRQRIEAF